MVFQFLSFILFSILIQTTRSLQTCKNSCGIDNRTIISFPFGLNGTSCPFPGFNLTCNNLHHPTLTLPATPAVTFTVLSINYQSQFVKISDPGSCLPARFLNGSFSLSNSPFQEFNGSFTYLDCPLAFLSQLPNGARLVPCLSKENQSVVALPTGLFDQHSGVFMACTVKNESVRVPVAWPLQDSITHLAWRVPDCKSCERDGGSCGFKGDTGKLRYGCSGLPSEGFPRSAKYGLILGAGIPGILFIIAITCHLLGRIKQYIQRGRPNTEFNTTVSQQSITISGLDGPTIESYPKSQLGASRRLPKPNDNTCSICLCEYQPKETLRTIPDCSHYFHVECIDEWLKVNATCPLCRNTPDSSTITTPSSSSSFSTSPSSSSLSTPR